MIPPFLAGISMGKAIVAFVAAAAIVAFVAAAATAALLFGLYKSIYNAGYRAGEALLTNYKAEQSARTVETIREVEKIVVKVEKEYVDRIIKVKEKGDVITRTVTEYIKVPDDAACELRAGFVRLHDAAAANQPAGASGDADREPAGVALSQAAAVIADNYGACHLWREQALGCRAFYEAVKSKVNAGAQP
jgi:hypothetical protein